MKNDIFEYFLDSIICFESSGLIIYINPAACTLLDLSQIRVENKKIIQDLILIDNSPFQNELSKNSESIIKLAFLKTSANNEVYVKMSIIPLLITGENYSIAVFKDLNHEVELHKKYQREMQIKDQKIRETNLINSVLNSIRITREPLVMIRQISLQLMNECDCTYSFLINKENDAYALDIITGKENRSKVIKLGVPKTTTDFKERDEKVFCGRRAALNPQFLSHIEFNYFCLIRITDMENGIFLLLPLKSPLSETQLKLFEAVRDQTSLSISSSMYERLANIDELTRVYNRRYFIQCSQPFFELTENKLKNCSVIILDIDHFKKLNDNEGHLFGDQALKVIGDLLKKQVRISDIVARYGGEEFVILLPETTQKEALLLAERIRVAIANTKIEKDSHSRFITASFGVAGKIETSAINIEYLIGVADKALYQSKNSGRNKVTEALTIDQCQ